MQYFLVVAHVHMITYLSSINLLSLTPPPEKFQFQINNFIHTCNKQQENIILICFEANLNLNLLIYMTYFIIILMTSSRANHCKKYSTNDIPYNFCLFITTWLLMGKALLSVRQSWQQNRLFIHFQFVSHFSKFLKNPEMSAEFVWWG